MSFNSTHPTDRSGHALTVKFYNTVGVVDTFSSSISKVPFVNVNENAYKKI